MTFTLSTVMYIIAVVLFILAALPPTNAWPLTAVGLAFFAAGHALP